MLHTINSAKRRKMRRKLLLFVSLFMVLALALSACQQTTTPPVDDQAPAVDCRGESITEAEGKYQVPAPVEGCFNVAFVYVGPHDDGGWSQSHDVGRLFAQENLAGVHTAYVENVAEGVDSEQVTRSLARKGFDMIFTTSFGFMDATETVAAEFPDKDFVHVSGYKHNGSNFGNLMGAMEDIKYLAGILAGSRAKKDGSTKIGYMATFPIPEELRLGNAFALGVQKTCPECTIDVRFIFTWHDPTTEQEGAKSLFDGGAQVVMTGADTPAPAIAAPEGKWGITYDYINNCTVDSCLTTMYWNWGPIYKILIEQSMNGTFAGEAVYFDADADGLGLYGFMEGQELMPGARDLPEEDLQLVRDELAAFLSGKKTRFDLFTGPITDNQGNLVLAEGEQLRQVDLDCFAQAEGAVCADGVGMYWWNENITAELPDL
jgi:basic membrane protein A